MLARLISHRSFTDECVSAAPVGHRSGGGLRAVVRRNGVKEIQWRPSVINVGRRSETASANPASPLKDVAT
jgi:hypothetical protein